MKAIVAANSVVVAVGLSLGRANAQPREEAHHVRVNMTWTSSGQGSACLTTDELERAVEGMLERKVFVSEGADALVRGTLQCSARDVPCSAHVVMSKSDGAPLGVRNLTSPSSSCAELREAVAVVLSVAIDSLETEVVRLALPEHPPLEKPWRGWIAPLGALSYGRLPGVAFGFGLAAQVEPVGMWPIMTSFTEWASTRASDGPLGASISGWQASLSACPAVLRGQTVSLEGCLGAELARLQATGTGLDVNRDAHSWIPAALAQAAVFVSLGRRFALSLPLGMEVPFVRDAFVYGRDGTPQLVYRPSAVGLFGGIGLGVTIP